MKKSLSLWQFAGFVLTSFAGTLLHFLYKWTGNSVVVAPFSAVNESIWEHMKLLFFPMFIFAIIQSRFFKDEFNNFWCVKLIGIISGLIIIPVLYYTYTGVLGVSADWFNIVIFFIAAATAYLVEAKLFKGEFSLCLASTLSIIIICLIALLFIIFTFIPPQIPLFADPVSKTYGIQ